MTLVIFNLRGLLMLAVGFGAAFGIGALCGTHAEGMLMMIASPFLVASDLIYRGTKVEKSWFRPDGGGMLFFVPIWIWGTVWLVLGFVDSIRAAKG